MMAARARTAPVLCTVRLRAVGGKTGRVTALTRCFHDDDVADAVHGRRARDTRTRRGWIIREPADAASGHELCESDRTFRVSVRSGTIRTRTSCNTRHCTRRPARARETLAEEDPEKRKPWPGSMGGGEWKIVFFFSARRTTSYRTTYKQKTIIRRFR